MNNSDENRNIDYLLFLLVEGSLDTEGFISIETWLSADPQNQEYYCNFIKDYAAMKMQVNAVLMPEENDGKNADIFDREAWHALAEMEKDADVVEISKACQEPCIQAAPVAIKSNPVNKTSLITAIVSIAALISMIAFVNLFPKVSREPVATIVDAINARWEHSNNQRIGERLLTRDSLMGLQQGVVKIQFDNGAQVIVEAPSRFELIACDQMNLQSGKLYAVVPQEAIGFTVNTPSARIIDLGTEFGIEAAASGDTYLHVIKGKTTLIAGQKSNKISMEVGRGDAKIVSAATSAISDITLGQELFVRDINSNTNIIWRGENVELASIIAGGNGLNPVFDFQTLNPNTGNYETKPSFNREYSTNSTYNRVSGNVFIDGVFVPDGSKSPVTITSQGHHFACPATSGKFNRNIAVFYKPYDKTFTDVRPASFDGITYGTEKHPCVLLHSNAGITIDLDRIREAYPGMNIRQLQTGYGLQWPESAGGEADFFVLVDGILKHKDTALVSRQTSQSRSVTIPLGPDARFLTFIVTDKLESSVLLTNEAYFCDVFFLLNPRLILQ